MVAPAYPTARRQLGDGSAILVKHLEQSARIGWVHEFHFVGRIGAKLRRKKAFGGAPLLAIVAAGLWFGRFWQECPAWRQHVNNYARQAEAAHSMVRASVGWVAFPVARWDTMI